MNTLNKNETALVSGGRYNINKLKQDLRNGGEKVKQETTNFVGATKEFLNPEDELEKESSLACVKNLDQSFDGWANLNCNRVNGKITCIVTDKDGNPKVVKL